MALNSFLVGTLGHYGVPTLKNLGKMFPESMPLIQKFVDAREHLEKELEAVHAILAEMSPVRRGPKIPAGSDSRLSYTSEFLISLQDIEEGIPDLLRYNKFRENIQQYAILRETDYEEIMETWKWGQIEEAEIELRGKLGKLTPRCLVDSIIGSCTWTKSPGDFQDLEFKLLSCDGKSYQMSAEIAFKSDYLWHLVETGSTESRLTSIGSEILDQVFEFLFSMKTDADLCCAKEAFELEFNLASDKRKFQLHMAADYLGVQPLLDFTRQAIANMIEGKTPWEIKDAICRLERMLEEEY